MTINPGELALAAPADTIPREYNFAADLFRRFREAGWLPTESEHTAR